MSRMFIEFSAFSRLVKAGSITGEMLHDVQKDIMLGGGDTIGGTGGLKKIRCAAAGRGKSGGWRIIFADYPRQAKTIFIAAYPKNAKSNVTPAEKVVLRELKAELDRTVGDE